MHEKKLTIGSVEKINEGVLSIVILNTIPIGTFLFVAFRNCSIRSEKKIKTSINKKIIIKE